MARPSKYKPEIAAVICEGLSFTDRSLGAICGGDGMPDVSTVYRWLEAHEEFRDKYARARELQAEFMAGQIVAIADEVREGVKTEERETGDRECSACDRLVVWRSGEWVHSEDKSPICAKAKAAKVMEIKTVTGDMVERARLQIDARKWLASKLAPKKYGDKLDIEASGPNGGPMALTITLLKSGE